MLVKEHPDRKENTFQIIVLTVKLVLVFEDSKCWVIVSDNEFFSWKLQPATLLKNRLAQIFSCKQDIF